MITIPKKKPSLGDENALECARAALLVKLNKWPTGTCELSLFRKLCRFDSYIWKSLCPNIDTTLAKVDQILEYCNKSDIKILCYGEAGFPPAFLNIPHPPLLLFVRGHIFSGEILSVVGSRKIDLQTRAWLDRELSAWLEKHSYRMTASGGAPGVDTEVHRISLLNQRRTLVFLPCGFDFECSWIKWQRTIGDENGAVISEYAPRTPVRRGHFHQRNRLIAAISPALLVAQASLKSGTMITANLAVELGREVLIVPGHPNHPGFSGSLKLAQEGAAITLKSHDIDYLMPSIINELSE